ncbi:hypothetical protein [Glutamicibacter arilaitensis]|uniref:hypothetical protein n=1 Tax=Glutamicibacter arilaitensis TaxID=256701 RepID=UPI0038500E76
MEKSTAQIAHQSYDQYEQALGALLRIPSRLNSELATAATTAAGAKQAADSVFQQTQARLAGLGRNANSRYSLAVEALKPHNVLLPLRVRAESSMNGDDAAVRLAVAEHASTITEIDAEIRKAIASAAQDKASSGSRAEVRQQAALALDLRRERIGQERAQREAEIKELALRVGLRRKRILISVSAAAAVVAVAAISLIVSLIR